MVPEAESLPNLMISVRVAFPIEKSLPSIPVGDHLTPHLASNCPSKPQLHELELEHTMPWQHRAQMDLAKAPKVDTALLHTLARLLLPSRAFYAFFHG